MRHESLQCISVSAGRFDVHAAIFSESLRGPVRRETTGQKLLPTFWETYSWGEAMKEKALSRWFMARSNAFMNLHSTSQIRLLIPESQAVAPQHTLHAKLLSAKVAI